MHFPSAEQLAAWKKTTVSHAAWDDWFDELEGAYLKDEPVAARLRTVAKGHSPKHYNIQHVALDGLDVSLTWDAGEDGFRESAGDFAALMRSAESFGAQGTFYFLGTAGAEGDFAYELRLDGQGGSSVRALRGNAMRAAYGEGYEAFMGRVMAFVEDAVPAVKKHLTELREGVATTASGDALQQRLTQAMASFTPAQLAAAAKSFPGHVPDGRGQQPVAKVVTAANAHERLGAPPNEELRAVALWVVVKLAPEVGRAAAKEVLVSKKASLPLRAGALFTLGLTRDDDEAVALALAPVLDARTELQLVWASAWALQHLQHRALEAKFADALAVLAKQKAPKHVALSSPGVVVLDLVAKHRWRRLAGALATLARSKADLPTRQKAAELVLAFDDEAAVRALLPLLSGPAQVAVPAAKAWLRIQPDAALALIEQAASSRRRVDAVDRRVAELLTALEDELRQKRKKARIANDPRWAQACEGLFELRDHYLAHRALPLVGRARKDPALQKRLIALLRSGKQSPLPVIEALKAQGVKNVTALIRARIAASRDAREKELLRVFL